jgi:hypothetical protein
MSKIAAAWPVAGNGLRGGSGESAEFPTSVKGVVAMFVEVHDHIVGGSLYDNAPFMSLSAAY